jgi:hypothetical protein
MKSDVGPLRPVLARIIAMLRPERQGLAIDLVPCPRSVFEQEKDEINTLPRAAYARGRLLYEHTKDLDAA